MSNVRIRGRISADEMSEADKASMLPGTLIVQSNRDSSAPRQVERRLLVNGPVRSTFQCCARLAYAGKHSAHHVNMARLAGVRGAEQGKLPVAESQKLRRAGFHQGQSLKRLDG
jgi:hypothetical protein